MKYTHRVIYKNKRERGAGTDYTELGSMHYCK